jgi:hypothetical protein
MEFSHGPWSRSVSAVLTALQAEAVVLYRVRMYKLDLLKLDPVAHLLILAVLALEIYTSFVRGPDAGDVDLLRAALAACTK